ncbi:MAG: diguanylate phosphodiesterase, partial [Thiomonas sp.]|nr:diguanylate phosphodiesterase [Thiomonas sp.]
MNNTAHSPDTTLPDAQGAVMHAHIARQPLVDRKQQIVGYELFARESSTAQQAPARHSAETDSVLL